MLKLDFHHHTILVRCNESLLLQKLQDEFHFFAHESDEQADTIIDLLLEAPPSLPPMVAIKILEHAVIYRMGARQYVDYFGEALIIRDFHSKEVRIYSLNPDRLYELGFLVVHSLLGQKLDLKGLCRLHAVAVSLKKTNAIVMLPSKGGKSTLLTQFLDNPEIKIISDDMPLCDKQGRIHPFPSKMSLHEVPASGPLSSLKWQEFRRHHYPPKWTASLSQIKDRIDPHPELNDNLLIAGFRLSSGESILTKVPKWKMILPLAEHMIIGVGLPQIIEMFLAFKISDLIKLPAHAVMRSICAVNLMRKARCYYFYMGSDKSYNAQLILDLLYEHQSS